MLVFLVSALATLVVSTITILNMSNTAQYMNTAKQNMDITEAFLLENYMYRLRATAGAAQNLLSTEDFDHLRIVPGAPNSNEAWLVNSVFMELNNKLISFRNLYGLEQLTYYFRIDNHLQPLISDGSDSIAPFTPISSLVNLNSSARDAWNEHSITIASGEFFVDADGLMTAYAPILNDTQEVYALVRVDIKDEHLHVLRDEIIALTDRIELLSSSMNTSVIGMITALILLVTGGILTFLSNRKRAVALREALIQAEDANRAKSSFLATMSHEIRTPMNAILGITEIQLQNESLAPPMAEALNKIYASGDLLLGIINDILDLSKIEAGKLELSVE